MLEPFTGPFEGHRLERQAAGGPRRQRPGAARYRARPARQRRVRAVNRLLAAGEAVGMTGRRRSTSAASAATGALLQADRQRSSASASLARADRGREPAAIAARRASGCGISTAARWNPDGRDGSSSSSSSRSTRVFAPRLDAGDLNAKYDVLDLPERRDPGSARRRPRRTRRRRGAGRRRTCPRSTARSSAA